jgi:hypothetical protein
MSRFSRLNEIPSAGTQSAFDGSPQWACGCSPRRNSIFPLAAADMIAARSFGQSTELQAKLNVEYVFHNHGFLAERQAAFLLCHMISICFCVNHWVPCNSLM